MTVDAGLTVMSGFGGEEVYIDAFLEEFSPRREDARAFAIRNRVILIASKSGIGIDVALGAMPFEANAVARATPYNLNEEDSLTTCSAEDLIVFKAFANRDKDWVDVRGVLVRQRAKLLIDQILGELRPLAKLKDDSSILTRLNALLAETGSD